MEWLWQTESEFCITNGVIFPHLRLSGLSPFAGDSDAETFANITRAEFDFDDDAFVAISDDAKDFITSLLISRKEWVFYTMLIIILH